MITPTDKNNNKEKKYSMTSGKSSKIPIRYYVYLMI